MKRSLIRGFLALFPMLALAGPPAAADVRLSSSCPVLRGFSHNISGKCFSTHPCRVGVRGDWLDLTDRVTVLSSRPTASVRITTKGTEDSAANSCIPRTNRSREGFVALELTDIEGSGELRLRLSRPAAGGRDEDTITIQVEAGEAWIKPDRMSAVVNEPKTFVLEGGSLTLLQLKDPIEPGDEILDKRSDRATVRLTFTRTGMMSLDDKVKFLVKRTNVNDQAGWSTIAVRQPGTGAPAPANPQSPTSPPRSGSTQPSEPNLLPVQLFANRPLLRKINTLAATEIPGTFCTGFGNNEERDVDVPAFEWGVSNDNNRSDVTTPFIVQLLDGNNVLATQQITRLNGGQMLTFRNWRGRPSRVRAVKVTGPPLLSQYGNAVGCYLVSSSPLDPRPITIRVDAGGTIPERVEVDNDLPVN